MNAQDKTFKAGGRLKAWAQVPQYIRIGAAVCMKKRSKKIMLIIIGVLLGIIGITAVFFNIPYSKTKAEFMAMSDELIAKTGHENGVFTE